jgi:hypothetical protein
VGDFEAKIKIVIFKGPKFLIPYAQPNSKDKFLLRLTKKLGGGGG